MCAKKKKEDEGPAEAPAWMSLYSTLMTLLMAFFVVLSTLGTFGGEKFHQAAASVKQAFVVFPSGGFGMMNKKSANVGRVKPHFKVTQPKMIFRISGGEVEDALKTTAEEGVQDIQVLYLKNGGVLIRIPEIALFNRGTAIVKEKSYELLDSIIRLFRDRPYSITVQGYTDDVFEPGLLYSSNWELSAMRAVNIVRYLHLKGKIGYNNLNPLGYSQFRPVADNNTEEGRAKNRRIELLLEPVED